MSDKPRNKATQVGHLGRAPRKFLGAVNTPIFRATTMLFPTVADLDAAVRGEYDGIGYGLHGLPTITDLQAAIATLDGGHAALAVPSGLTATTLPLLALARPGDHILVTDSVYGPTRRFCELHLKRLGVEVSYYDPLLGADIAAEFRPNTKIVFVESPGSLTFDVQDVPAIAKVAHARNALVIMDNSWATPLYFRAFDFGVDVSVHAATKYIGGHSDVGAAPTVDRHGRHRLQRRLFPRLARIAHAGDPPRAPPGQRHQGRRVAAHAAGSRGSHPSGVARFARP
jgi:cystathionine beta-lyase